LEVAVTEEPGANAQVEMVRVNLDPLYRWSWVTREPTAPQRKYPWGGQPVEGKRAFPLGSVLCSAHPEGVPFRKMNAVYVVEAEGLSKTTPPSGISQATAARLATYLLGRKPAVTPPQNRTSATSLSRDHEFVSELLNMLANLDSVPEALHGKAKIVVDHLSVLVGRRPGGRPRTKIPKGILALARAHVITYEEAAKRAGVSRRQMIRRAKSDE
jgi:hypothetical protein